jgi:general secretion pathway protein G
MFPTPRLQRSRRTAAAFTLMEIILVVVIIGIMLTLVAPRIAGKSAQAKRTAAQRQIDAFKTALQSYEFDVGEFPPALQALVVKPADVDENTWKGPYLTSNLVPKDPWQHEYQYKSPGEHYKDFDIWSTGRDGQDGNDDDITSWERER